MAAKQKPSPTWDEIASFYAGRPIRVDFDAEKQPGVPWPDGGWGGTWDGSRINMGPFQKKMLDQFSKNVRDPVKGVFGVAGIATLLHEAVHGRNPQPGTGFKSWNNEPQANALGSELIADMLHRFYGIPLDSKLSRKYMKAGKNLSSYIGAYADK